MPEPMSAPVKLAEADAETLRSALRIAVAAHIEATETLSADSFGAFRARKALREIAALVEVGEEPRT